MGLKSGQRTFEESTARTSAAPVNFQHLPDRTVVESCGSDDGRRIDVECRADPFQVRFRQRLDPGRRCGEGRYVSQVNIDDADPAFLPDHIGLLGNAARVQPSGTAAKRRVSGEQHLVGGSKDADLVVGSWILGRQKKGGLRQICPGSEILQLPFGEPFTINDTTARPLPLVGCDVKTRRTV